MDLELYQDGQRKIKIGKKVITLPRKWSVAQQKKFILAVKRKLQNAKKAEPKQTPAHQILTRPSRISAPPVNPIIPIVRTAPVAIDDALLHYLTMRENQSRTPVSEPIRPTYRPVEPVRTTHVPAEPIRPTHISAEPVRATHLSEATSEVPKKPKITMKKPMALPVADPAVTRDRAHKMLVASHSAHQWRGKVRGFVKDHPRLEVKSDTIDSMTPEVASRFLLQHHDVETEKEYERQLGSGLVKNVVQRISDVLRGVRERASPSIRNFLKQHGQAKITKIVVGRQPVTPMVEKVASWLSLGKYDQNKKDAGYDKMLHLFMIISLDKGPTFKLEKNHVPQITQTSDAGSDTISVETPSDLSLDEFFKRAEAKAGGTKLWVYESATQNCQFFVKWCLQGAGVWTEALDRFVMQDALSVYKGLPLFQRLAKGLTDTANVLDVAVNGARKPDGFQGLDNFQIDKVMSRYPAYVGTLPYDGLPLLLPKLRIGQRVATVMNTDRSGSPGEHWFALYIDPIDSKSVEYYDSSGDGIPSDLLHDIKLVADKVSPNEYLKLKENRIQRQGDSNNCGFFAMKFLLDRFRGLSYPEATAYDDSEQGEKDIEKMKRLPRFRYLT